MAPYAINSSPGDDFILTISDNDEGFPVLDSGEEDFAIKQPGPNTKNIRKRNRDPDDNYLPTKNTAKSRKKSKLSQAPSHQDTNGDSRLEHEDQTWSTQGEDDGAMDSDFEFMVKDNNNGAMEDFDEWGLYGKNTAAAVNQNKKSVDIDELIARRKKSNEKAKPDGGVDLIAEKSKSIEDSSGGDLASEVEDVFFEEQDEDETMAEDGFGMGVKSSDEESDDTDGTHSDSDDISIAEPVPHPHDDVVSDTRSVDESDDPEESARRKAFFAPEEKNMSSAPTIVSSKSFQGMSLSRPILRGLASVGFSEPTPIQKKTIPIALLGKDVVGGAVTGSGKTAAFIIPILERLLYRPRKIPTSRVVILMPTRELAVQCFQVVTKLAGFTDITFCQMVGGFSLREQESVLRSRPDVIIATPGRFIDHMRNSASFTVDTLEILVLDEADRMLEDGFADELNEILTTIPKSRQTMLFSATMTDQVDKLIRVGLNRPVRLMVDAKKQTVGTLVQEFVRLRPGREDKRLGYLLHLCENVYTEKVIIFFRQKKEAHRVRVIFGLCGLKATELHGNMTQEQRSASLSSFCASQATHLLATDLAARGLDIPSVSCVLNYEAPQSPTIYLHRVGRTARAGRSGYACTLAAEPDRKVVKQVVRMAKAQGAKIVSRVVDAKLADDWAEKVGALEAEVEAVLAMEKEERAMGDAEREATRGENKIVFEEEIKGRPKRTWFENEKEKKEAKEMGARELNGVANGKGKGKLSAKAKKRLDDHRDRVEGRVWKKGKENTEEKKEKGKGKGNGKGKDGKAKREKGAKNKFLPSKKKEIKDKSRGRR